MKKRIERASFAVAAVAALVVLAAASDGVRPVNDAAIAVDGYPATLSEFGFFTDLKTRTPAPRMFGYQLNTPLFSDYTEKQRYLYVPTGKVARYDADAVIDLPVGSAIVKTFGYGRNAAFRPIETRVLLRRSITNI